MTVVDVIIPAYNEENSVAKVIAKIPKTFVREIIVVNNNSSDATSQMAKEAGATVLFEKQQGYGFACLKGIDYCRTKEVRPDIVVFLDADYSDYPEQMTDIVRPILEKGYDMVLGSRLQGDREKGAMLTHQILGTWLSTFLMKIFYGAKYTDLGPFRAIKFSNLLELDMRDKTYGWTIEMQIKAAKQNLKTCEVPVSYRKRIGASKVSGTIKGTVFAGYRIIATILKYL